MRATAGTFSLNFISILFVRLPLPSSTNCGDVILEFHSASISRYLLPINTNYRNFIFKVNFTSMSKTYFAHERKVMSLDH